MKKIRYFKVLILDLSLMSEKDALNIDFTDV